jgi:hypothetical protein
MKMHDTRVNAIIPTCDNYRVEFNQERQLFHYDDGSHEENTFGWRTACRDVKNIAPWRMLDDIRSIFNYKFPSLQRVMDKYIELSAIIERASPDENLTVEKCIEFLKENGYKGKVEKIEILEIEL